MIRAILPFLMILVSFGTMAQSKNEILMLVGTYSNKEKTNGIHPYVFNTLTGEFRPVGTVAPLENASYLAVSADRKNVFAVSEMGGGKGSVNAYSLDPSSGKLQFINSVNSGGDHPCYVSVDIEKKVVFVGNYSGGNLLAVLLEANGKLSSNGQLIQHEGGSVNKSRQEKPHVHSVVLSPDEKYLMVPDLGADKVFQYKINVKNPSPLTPAAHPFAAAEPGTGPRHLTFHPNGKYAYLALELEAKVAVFEYADGNLTPKQTVSMLKEGFDGKVSAADIHVSPDGKFLYASNRGDANEIAIFSIDKNGLLAAVGHQSVLGKTPRNFAIDPTGNYLLAANQDSNDIIIFKRDLKKGLLTSTGKKIELERPVCLKFVK